MPPPRRNSSGMGYERKRPSAAAHLSILPESEQASSTTVFGRQFYRTSAHTATPPASAFFPLLSADTNDPPRPTPDAEPHFAYSTTLRRHPEHPINSPAGFASVVNAEAISLWQRAIGMVTGQHPSQQEAAENGEASPQIPKEDRRDTLSARFAHCSVEVCFRSPSCLGTFVYHSRRKLLPTSALLLQTAYCPLIYPHSELNTATMNSPSLPLNLSSSNLPRQYTRAR